MGPLESSLPYRWLILKFKITAVSLDSNKYVRVNLQTNATLDEPDWKTVTNVTFTEGSQTTPYVAYGLASIEDTVPLSRFARWEVEFESSTASQHVTFSVVGVARE